MKTTVHHQPANASLSYNLHIWKISWDATTAYDFDGNLAGKTVDFALTNIPDLRKFDFKYNSVNSATNTTTWEPDSFIRTAISPAPAEIWTFEFSPRIIYSNPFPGGVAFKQGDVVTINVVTQNQFNGGLIYVWDGYNAANTPLYFSQTTRDNAKFISAFTVTLSSWMTGGFHFKLKSPGTGPRG
jgi:hypothetical protein